MSETKRRALAASMAAALVVGVLGVPQTASAADGNAAGDRLAVRRAWQSGGGTVKVAAEAALSGRPVRS